MDVLGKGIFYVKSHVKGKPLQFHEFQSFFSALVLPLVTSFSCHT